MIYNQIPERWLVCSLANAQSNERGTRRSDLNSDAEGLTYSRTGTVPDDPIPPEVADGGINGSMWPYALDKVFPQTGSLPIFANTAVAATGTVDWAGTSTGEYDGVVQDVGDPNWDPNGYLLRAYTHCQIGKHLPKSKCIRAVFMSMGQRDASALLGVGSSLDVFKAGLRNAINYFLSDDIHVILGFTFFKTGTEDWYDGVGNPAIVDLLSEFSNEPRVYAGPNLDTLVGRHPGTRYDDAHAKERGYDLGADAWGDAIVSAVQSWHES